MTVRHFMDAETMKGRIRRPIRRVDMDPPHPNPVRAFREELRLSRERFAELCGVPVETLRAWERDKKAMIPGRHRLNRLIEIARRNEYPLMVYDLLDWAEKSRE